MKEVESEEEEEEVDGSGGECLHDEEVKCRSADESDEDEKATSEVAPVLHAASLVSDCSSPKTRTTCSPSIDASHSSPALLFGIVISVVIIVGIVVVIV